MRKYFFILLLCSSSMMAQNTNSDYQAFRKGVLGSYDSFRKTVLEDYAEYLQGVWDEYEQFRGIKRDKEPKPSKTPKADIKPQDVTPVQSAPEVKPTVQPTPAPSDNPTTVQPIVPNTLPNMYFSFYGKRGYAFDLCRKALLRKKPLLFFYRSSGLLFVFFSCSARCRRPE